MGKGKGKKSFIKPISPKPIDTSEGPAPKNALEKQQAIVIPLVDGNTIGRKQELLRTDIPDLAYNPKKFGLQTRRKADKTIPPPTPLSTIGDLREPMNTLSRPSPISEELKLQQDLEKLPEAPNTTAYSKVPVEDFGKALLRGMGWSEKSSPKQPKNVESQKRRPPLLGLGGKLDDPNLIKRPDYISSRKAPKSQTTQSLVVGSFVTIIQGQHAFVGGRLERLVGKDSAIVRLVSDEIVQLPTSHLNSGHQQDNSTDIEEAIQESLLSAYPLMKVQIISKKYRQSRYYLCLAEVLDVAASQTCTVRTLRTGDILHDIPMHYLKACQPSLGEPVFLLSGDHAGQKAVLLSLEGSNGILELSEDSTIIISVPLNHFSAIV